MWVGPNKDQFQISLEIPRKAYWALIRDAADTEQHIEEFLEAYIDTMWGEAIPVKSKEL